MRLQQRTKKKTLPQSNKRRGIIVVVTGFTLIALFAFMALSVDTGRIVLEETRMQNAVDAAASGGALDGAIMTREKLLNFVVTGPVLVVAFKQNEAAFWRQTSRREP